MVLFTMALLLPSSLQGQATSAADGYRCRIYSHYVDGTMNGWLSTISAMEACYSKEKDEDLLLEIVRSYYGYIPLLINREQNAQADSLLNRAFAYLHIYRGRHPKDGEAMSLHSSFLGYRLALHPSKVLFYGPKCQELIEKAVSAAPNNPWVLLDQANALLYTPSFFGGNPKRALRIYLYSISLLEKKGGNECSWNYLNAYINLAYCQIKLKQYAEAQQSYSHLLKVAPNFKWIEQQLVPRLQKKMEKDR